MSVLATFFSESQLSYCGHVIYCASSEGGLWTASTTREFVRNVGSSLLMLAEGGSGQSVVISHPEGVMQTAVRQH